MLREETGMSIRSHASVMSPIGTFFMPFIIVAGIVAIKDEYILWKSIKGDIDMANCNEANCTCSNKDCERHGKCCECINFHINLGNKVFCMKDKVEKNK